MAAAADWREGVFYQIYPRSFRDSDGDGVGDLAGICERLDYVAGLGVDGIWLSPFFRSPMRDYGYDVSDYCDVDPLFGDLAGFGTLLDRAHGLGLKVIIDQVYSHTSSDHPWFRESREARTGPKADWYVWADARPDGSAPNNWLAAFGGRSWSWEPRRRQYYLHNFLESQPDLDVSNPAVQEALLGVARFWLDLGVDGFRLDVANCYVCDPGLADNPPSGVRDAARPSLMQRHVNDRDQPGSLVFAARLRALVDARPGRFLLAELASDDPEGAIALYASGPDRYHTAYAFRFLSRPFSAEIIRRGVEEIRRRAPDAWPSFAFSNHDFERVASRWGAGRPPGFPKTLLALLTSLRGTPFVYQGEELGLREAQLRREDLRDPDGVAFWPAYKGRDGCRTPMPWRSEPKGGFTTGAPWLPLDPDQLALSVERQAEDPASALAFARRWLAFRRGEPALRRGELAFRDAPEPVLDFERAAPEGRLRLVFDLGDAGAVAEAAPGDVLAFDSGASLEGGRLTTPPGGFGVLRRPS